MQVLRNFSLKDYNSFGIDVKAGKFVSIKNLDDLRTVLRKNYASELFVLGGGSNILFIEEAPEFIIVDEAPAPALEPWEFIKKFNTHSQLLLLGDLDQQIFDYRDDINPERLNFAIRARIFLYSAVSPTLSASNSK